MVTERYDKAFTAANLKKEQEFYASDLSFSIRLTFSPRPQGEGPGVRADQGRTVELDFTLGPEDSFPKVFEEVVRKAFAPLPQPSPAILPPSLDGRGQGGWVNC
ncbi:MAG: hypothetical protein AB1512_23300 [Thermodesulfobacteriota bacterium]